MGQHATIHGKTVEDFNGQSGKWIPIQVDSNGNLGIQLLSGELQQFNRFAAGSIFQYAVVTSDATGLDIANGPAIFYGMTLVSATGQVDAVYDSLTAAGTQIAGTATGSFMYGGAGLLCNTGITVNWNAGTWVVLYVPQS